MTPLDAATIVLLVGPALGLAGAAAYAVTRRGATRGLTGRTALARAGSYAALAIVFVIAGRTGVVGIAVVFALIGAAGLLEWARLFDLPRHHAVALVVAHVVVIGALAAYGRATIPSLVAIVVFAGVAFPVVRSDTGRAVRDLGYAAVGAVLLTVMLAHGVALAQERGDVGIAIVLALAVACAGADVGAFVVGRRFGRHPLAPSLSPNKTREGAIGNIAGAAVGLLPFAPSLAPVIGWPVVVLLVPLVAGGSIWGDLLESAAKREAGVKDAGRWLPGFGGILDRVDSLLVTVALAYWIVRLWGNG
jgi:phosphatidate cytidylyltransferase